MKEGLSLKEIAKKRGFSEDTIIGHIEKLVELHVPVTLENILPKEKDVQKIADAFVKLDTRKLTPVYEKLKGKYTYHEIRLVRASLGL